MKPNNWKCLFSIVCVVACFAFSFTDAFAAEKVTEGRKTYNTIMLWVNFGILVVVFIKFARKPLMDALRAFIDKVAGELNGIKTQHSENEKTLNVEMAKVENIQNHLDGMRSRIIEMGEKEKKKIIEQAKLAAEKMIDDAKAYAGFQMEKARKELSDEMVDLAISLVEEKLAEEISQEDNEKLINDFLVNLETTKPHLN